MGYTADLTATMDSYTTPSPNKVYYSSDYPGYEAWRAFDKSTVWPSGYWYNYPTGAGGWIAYDFGVGNEKVITKMTLKQSIPNYPYWTDSYILSGSNDTTNGSDGSWNALLIQGGVLITDTWAYYNTEERPLDNTTAYRCYKLESTHATGGDLCWVIAEMTLHANDTNIKVIDGLTKSNVKSINGLAIANVKTINGLA